MSKFIEWNNELYAVNNMQVTREGEFLVIDLVNGKKMLITGSDITLPMKYNVIRNWLDTGLIYNKLHNVLTFDDINKPDVFNTDGVYRDELIVGIEILRTSRLKLSLSDGTTKIVNLRRVPFWNLIKDYHTKEFVYFTPHKVVWDVKIANQEVHLTYDIQDIIATPILDGEQEEALNAEDDKNGVTKEVDIIEFKPSIEEVTEDGFDAAHKAVFNPLIPKKKKPRTTSIEKAQMEFNANNNSLI